MESFNNVICKLFNTSASSSKLTAKTSDNSVTCQEVTFYFDKVLSQYDNELILSNHINSITSEMFSNTAVLVLPFQFENSLPYFHRANDNSRSVVESSVFSLLNANNTANPTNILIDLALIGPFKYIRKMETP